MWVLGEVNVAVFWVLWYLTHNFRDNSDLYLSTEADRNLFTYVCAILLYKEHQGNAALPPICQVGIGEERSFSLQGGISGQIFLNDLRKVFCKCNPREGLLTPNNSVSCLNECVLDFWFAELEKHVCSLSYIFYETLDLTKFWRPWYLNFKKPPKDVKK